MHSFSIMVRRAAFWSEEQKAAERDRRYLEDMAVELDYATIQSDDATAWRQRFGEVVQAEGDDITGLLLTCVMAGKEFERPSLATAAERILRTYIPDLSVRMPWYRVMFAIADRGRFVDHTDPPDEDEDVTGDTSGAGPWFYELKSSDRESLGSLLEESGAVRRDGRGMYIVGDLGRDMGEMPGRQIHITFWSMPDSWQFAWSRIERMGVINSYLHNPMRRIATVDSDESSADFLYRAMQRDLKREAA